MQKIPRRSPVICPVIGGTAASLVFTFEITFPLARIFFIAQGVMFQRLEHFFRRVRAQDFLRRQHAPILAFRQQFFHPQLLGRIERGGRRGQRLAGGGEIKNRLRRLQCSGQGHRRGRGGGQRWNARLRRIILRRGKNDRLARLLRGRRRGNFHGHCQQ